jgi:hypothetical protein
MMPAVVRVIQSLDDLKRDGDRFLQRTPSTPVCPAERPFPSYPPIEARRQALLKFGNVEAIKEIYRDQRGLPFMETLLRDTRHAIRRLRRTPAFTAAALLTLTFGIGANTDILGVIDSILIRPLAYPHARYVACTP